MTLKSSNSAKPANKTVLEKLGMNNEESHLAESNSRKRKASVDEEKAAAKKAEKGDKKEFRKTAADRREELLKQLKAVENAIAKKRTKLDE